MLTGFSPSSLNSTRKPVLPSLAHDAQFERNSLLNPVAVSRGTVLANLGGIVEVRDTTGGTVLFTIDPSTGTVTIAGGVVANQTLNLGTINNTSMSGNTMNDGTFYLGVGTAGTIYNSTFNVATISSSLITASTVTSPIINSPYIVDASIQGISSFSVNSGSNALPTSGNMELQTYGSAVNIVVNYGGTTFRFNPTGTI